MISDKAKSLNDTADKIEGLANALISGLAWLDQHEPIQKAANVLWATSDKLRTKADDAEDKEFGKDERVKVDIAGVMPDDHPWHSEDYAFKSEGNK